jgi:hypothetical protein
MFKLSTELAQARLQFEGGFPIGVLDALFLCLETYTPPPAWVADNAAEAFEKVLGLKGPKGKGTKSRAGEHLRQDIRHFHRYDAVQVASAEGLKGQAKFNRAYELLMGTTSGCTISTIENSYGLVLKALKTPTGVARFRPPRSQFVADLVTRKGKAAGKLKGQ